MTKVTRFQFETLIKSINAYSVGRIKLFILPIFIVFYVEKDGYLESSEK